MPIEEMSIDKKNPDFYISHFSCPKVIYNHMLMFFLNGAAPSKNSTKRA